MTSLMAVAAEQTSGVITVPGSIPHEACRQGRRGKISGMTFRGHLVKIKNAPIY